MANCSRAEHNEPALNDTASALSDRETLRYCKNYLQHDGAKFLNRLKGIAMRRIMLMLMLAVSTHSGASTWVKVNEDERSITYANSEALHETGNEVKLWWMSDFKAAQTSSGDVFLSSRRQYEFNCKEGQYRPLFFARHAEKMAEGNPVYSSSATGEWKTVPSGTIGEILLKFACGTA